MTPPCYIAFIIFTFNFLNILCSDKMNQKRGEGWMNVGKAKRYTIWIIWAVVFPISIIFSFIISPPLIEGRIPDVICFALLVLISSSIPIVINGIPIYFFQWISLVIFLEFGLAVEILVLQLSVIVLLWNLGVNKNDLYRLPLNSIMFLFMSIGSALVFYGLGGTHENYEINNFYSLSLLAVYLIVNFILNQLLLMMITKWVHNKKPTIFTRDLIWEVVSIIVVFPISISLFYLYNSMGLYSVIILGLPYLCISYILKTYNSTEKINYYLKKAVEIGRQMTERLNRNEVLDVFIDRLSKMLPVDYLYVLDAVNDDTLEVIKCYENGKQVDLQIEPMKRKEGISGLVWETKKAVLFHSKDEWVHIVHGYMPEDVESILCVPIMKDKEVSGVLLLASKNKKDFANYMLMIVEILCSYFAIALENARHYEKTKLESERCVLTNLYNYRYFSSELERQFDQLELKKLDKLALILIDIDHFKKINDTYGHESGNQILAQFAQLLTSILANKGTLARYGGEEFALLLPNYSKKEAFQLAEHIRSTIAEREFVLYDDLAEVRRRLTVRITASIGVSAAPDDTDDHLSLIRYADRALYTGAKQVGRNKVAQYGS